MLIYRLGSELHAQFVEYLDVHIGQHHRGVDLAAAELGKLGQSFFCGLVGGRAHAQGDEYLVGV